MLNLNYILELCKNFNVKCVNIKGRYNCGCYEIIKERWITSFNNISVTGATLEHYMEYGEKKEFILHPGGLAMLDMTHTPYMNLCKDKIKNLIVKSKKLNYKEISHEEIFKKYNIDELKKMIYDIRTSDPNRQNRPIPKSYWERKNFNLINPKLESLNCKCHREMIVGVELNNCLVAYAVILILGELAQVVQILVHVEHKKNGVSSMLMQTIYNYLKDCGGVRTINYLFFDQASENEGINNFKKNLGFIPAKLIITDGNLINLYQQSVAEISKLQSLINNFVNFNHERKISHKKVDYLTVKFGSYSDFNKSMYKAIEWPYERYVEKEFIIDCSLIILNQYFFLEHFKKFKISETGSILLIWSNKNKELFERIFGNNSNDFKRIGAGFRGSQLILSGIIGIGEESFLYISGISNP